MSEKIPVSVLAATGSVGQRFVQLLDQHPWFEVVALSGSERTVGMKYGEGCFWRLTDPMPDWAADMEVVPTTADAINTPIAFSALPSTAAGEIEAALAQKGVMVCSNASTYRTEPDVPILFPEVNPELTAMVDVQRRKRGWKGGIVTNSNCTSTGLSVALKALHDSFGLSKAFVVSLQAVSGAGYPGVPSLDMIDNVLPYIGGEEEKVEREPRKILGSVDGDHIKPADFVITAHTNRVPVSDGHLVCVSAALEKAGSPKDVIAAFQAYQAPEISQDLPSTPVPVIQYRSEDDRPQPRLDRMTGKGMTTVVGRVRQDALLDIKFVVLSHNTIRGAAGGSVYNAELLVKQGYVNR